MSEYKKGEILTLEKLESFNCDEIFASGFMKLHKDVPLRLSIIRVRWVAIKGSSHTYGLPHDWSIYMRYERLEHELMSGTNKTVKPFEKLIHRTTIKKLVPCTDEAFSLYR